MGVLEVRRFDVPAFFIGGKAGPIARALAVREDELREGETTGPPEFF